MSKHYENFPVASLLLPRRLRRPVSDLYAFARTADDFADEGDWPAAERLARLEALAQELDRIERNESPLQPMMQALADTMRRHQLPASPFRALLSAFRQDVEQSRYGDFDELLAYCQRSANPVGDLMLRLFDAHTSENRLYANAICTSLQLINFLQDIAIDLDKGRVYLPADEMAACGIRQEQLRHADSGGRWPAFMRFQTNRARILMLSGAPLGNRLPGRLGFEMRMVILGGLTILDRIDAVDGDVFRHRPVLRRRDWLRMFLQAASRRLPPSPAPLPLPVLRRHPRRQQENQ